MQASTEQLRVAIDLAGVDPADTPDVALRFVRNLVRNGHSARFILICRRANRHLLRDLEDAGVSNVTVAEPGPLDVWRNRIDARLPAQARRKRLARRFDWQPRSVAVGDLGADVLFCPYTPSYVGNRSLATVAAVHDLSHLSHPHLLTSRQRAARAHAFEVTARRARRLLCSSNEVREVAITDEDVSADRVSTLWPGALLLEASPSPAEIAATLEPFGLRQRHYWLVPGFRGEPPANLPLVLTAFGLFRARRPESNIELVFAGARLSSLRVPLDRMGIGRFARVIETHRTEELLRLTAGSRGVVVPRLYDTLGETALQAMALGRPVIVSNIPGLMSATAGAALTFDPHRPGELAAIFERLETESDLLRRLAEGGCERVAALESPSTVAEAYVAVFGEARCQRPSR